MNNDDDEMSDEAIIGEAIHRAKEAFKNYLESEHDIDPAFYSLRIVVRSVSSDLKCFLEEFVFDDRGSYECET